MEIASLALAMTSLLQMRRLFQKLQKRVSYHCETSNTSLKEGGVHRGYFTLCHHNSVCGNCDPIRRPIIFNQLRAREAFRYIFSFTCIIPHFPANFMHIKLLRLIVLGDRKSVV